jgi:siderophore synthetase component
VSGTRPPATAEPRAAAGPVSPPHLTPALWEEATRALVAKAVGEYAHERLVAPTPGADGRWVVTSDDGRTAYRFAARRGALDHWRVDPGSVTREHDDGPRPLDLLDLVLDLRGSLGLSDAVLPVYLEELTSTLASRAAVLARDPAPAATLAKADFQEIEAGMTAGHPCFVANSGRLGLDATEYARYAPEVGPRVRLSWLAAHRDRATFSATPGLDPDGLARAELDEDTRRRFDARLRALGLDPADYLLLPVHPWQWENRLAVTFAGDVARRHLVLLGESDDAYQPQQSIRTFFNTTRPDRSYVKTALSVVNMGFVRGLSAAYMQGTPAINDWVAGVVENDPVLAGTGVGVLRERAAVGYHPVPYEAATQKGSPYRTMLAALWRESPVPRLRDGERLATMASLLHVDRDGDALVTALVAESGLEAATWLRRYLDAYLVPLLHCFYAHALVFMPHGENVILVLDEGVPVRALLKDIGEEVAVLDPDLPLPPEVERIRAEVPDDVKPLSLLTDVVDCFLRFLAGLFDDEGLLDEDAFWAAVAACVACYQEANPQLAGAFARYDLFCDRFALSCLNRLQLRDNRQMVDLDDPASALSLAGTLANPLAPHGAPHPPAG